MLIVKVDRKGLKVTLARLSRVFLDIGLWHEAIAHQLVAGTGTYNVPAPSHIIRSVLIFASKAVTSFGC